MATAKGDPKAASREKRDAFAHLHRCYLFPKTLSGCMSHVAAAAMKKRGFDRPDMLKHWQDIIGGDLARRCAPLRLVPADGGALHVKVASGAHALEVQYAEPVILERLAAFYGRSVARRVVIFQ